MDRSSSRQELWRRRRRRGASQELAIFLLVVFLSPLLVSSQEAPTITVPPVDQDVSQGDSFTMTCSATGNGTISIQWEKDGLLLSNGVVMGNNLVFDEALPSHAGVYVCVASGEGGEARAEATVTVSYPPVFWSLSVDPEEVVNGSVVMMSCIMDGFPEPSVTWLHSGMKVVGSERVILSDSGSILTITEAILSDVGLYTCNASNDHGTAEADDHRLLMVYYPPMDMMVQGHPPELDPRLGERTELTCTALSMPVSTYSWWKEGEGRDEERVEDTSSVMTFGGNGSLLFVMVQREDAGSYYCNASNGYGSLVSQYLTLRVSAVPLAPTGLRLKNLSSTSANIHWDRISSSYPPVHTYHVEHRLSLDRKQWVEHNVLSNPNSFNITGLLPYACYLVRVSATSPVGRGDPSTILYIMTEAGDSMEYTTPDDSTTSGSLTLPPGLSFDCCVVAISEGVAPSDRNCIDPLMTPSTAPSGVPENVVPVAGRRSFTLSQVTIYLTMGGAPGASVEAVQENW